MSRVSDLTGLLLVGGVGVAAYTIYKNKDAIGDFFDNLFKGVNDFGNNVLQGVNDIGSKLDNAGTTIYNNTTKIIGDAVTTSPIIPEDKTKILTQAATPAPIKLISNVAEKNVNELIDNPVGTVAKSIQDYSANPITRIVDTFTDLLPSASEPAKTELKTYNIGSSNLKIDTKADAAKIQQQFADKGYDIGDNAAAALAKFKLSLL